MAQNALAAGIEITAYNRTPGKVTTLGKAAATAAEAAAAGEIVVTMLSDDAATEDVIFGSGGVLKALRPGGIHVAMSTISVALAKRLAEAHRAAGQVYVSSPVFGRPDAAAAKKLVVVPAGPLAALKHLQPLFDAIGQATFIMGEDPSAANVVKLSGNFLIASAIEAMGEAITLVRKYGVDPKQYFNLITSTLFNAPVYKTYGGLIASDNYQPVGFKMALGLKDVRLVQAAADAVTAPMPVANIVRDRMMSGVARGRQNDDWASFARMIAEEAGL